MALSGIDKELVRRFPYSNELKETTCFKQIENHVSEGILFPALRENCMDFYHRGQRAFRRTKHRFKSNDYFLKERPTGAKGKELSFSQFPYTSHQGECTMDIDDILACCKERGYSHNRESYQLSKMFSLFSFASFKSQPDILLLDIEARFASLTHPENKYRADKIDLVFFIPNERQLLFVEGKRRNDSRIRAKEGSCPEVIEQVKNYQNQINKRGENIISAYGNVCNIMKETFQLPFELPEPTSIVSQVPILVFDDPDSPTALSANENANDAWLEPQLISDHEHWVKDNTYTIDARKAFAEPEVHMSSLPSLLLNVVNKMNRQQAPLRKL